MAVLSALLALLLAGQPCAAQEGYQEEMPEVRRKALLEQKEKSCESTEEYKKTLAFMRDSKDFLVTETAARQIADQVSRGCTGAAARFSKILVMLKRIGISDRKALEMAFEFAKLPDYVQTNFTEIFTKSFLTEFFDYDFNTALALAFELSKGYKGDPVQVRNDFLDLVRFCKDGKNLDLPTKLCAEYTIRLARLSQYFEKGVRDPFFKVYHALRDKEEFSLDIKTALELSYNILSGGPKAIDNFFSAFKFAMEKDGLNYAQDKAMRFALKMAGRSFKGKEPVIIPGFDYHKNEVERALASEGDTPTVEAVDEDDAEDKAEQDAAKE